jgi:hypothetical protein
MTVYLVIFLPKLLYIHRVYIWFWPALNIYLGAQKMRGSVATALPSKTYLALGRVLMLFNNHLQQSDQSLVLKGA